jgi:prepilin-type N-terminal cleavage/methylation domain-containing protein
MLGGKNSKNKHPRGYTIIEVMIVLAVSGVMFVLAASFINGKQERTAFTEGVNDTASRLQDVIEQVGDGEYSDIKLNCQFNGSQTTFPTTLPSQNQGANSPCVFLGKLWYFPTLPAPTSETSAYQVLSIAGGRAVDTAGSPPTEITDLTNAHPAVITTLNSAQTINQQLTVRRIYVNGAVKSIKAFGFLQSQGSLDSVTGALQSGAQTVSLYYVNSSTFAPTVTTPAVPSLTAAKSVSLCLTDDTRYALIDVGANNGNALSVNITIEPSGVTC